MGHSTLTQSKKLFSFAVISDTHDVMACGLGLGKTPEAVNFINKLSPDFVIGCGDLVSGGGDCQWAQGKIALGLQLNEFRELVLKPLQVPFVPVSGNHDLDPKYSSNKAHSLKLWKKFWWENRTSILPEAIESTRELSFRFEHKGIGFSCIGYYGTDGLHHQELEWLQKSVKCGDFVFRHVNPFGISASNRFHAGFAIRTTKIKEIERLPKLLKFFKVRALFSGHTHAFYDCSADGLRFINTGTLGTRALEYVIGWEHSPYKKSQAFVWVDVFENLDFRINFYVWCPMRKEFFLFDKRLFPSYVKARKRWRLFYWEGISAMCCRRV